MQKQLATKTGKLRWIGLSVVIVILDQLSKYWILHHFSFAQVKPILPVFNLTLRYNQGAAFSFLSQSGAIASLLFSIVAIIIAVFIILWLARLPVNKRWLACGLALVLGGAIGNLIDRVVHGYVIDFLDFYIKQWHWPTFNIADSAICVGAIMLFIDVFFMNKKG